MKINKLKKYEKKIESPITENQHRANCERVADMLSAVAEKMTDSAPVAESFDTLLNQLKSGNVKRSPVTVNHHSGEIIRYNADGTKEILNSAITKDITFTDADAATTTLTITKDVTFTEAEKLILEQIQNG